MCAFAIRFSDLCEGFFFYSLTYLFCFQTTQRNPNFFLTRLSFLLLLLSFCVMISYGVSDLLCFFDQVVFLVHLYIFN